MKESMENHIFYPKTIKKFTVLLERIAYAIYDSSISLGLSPYRVCHILYPAPKVLFEQRLILDVNRFVSILLILGSLEFTSADRLNFNQLYHLHSNSKKRRNQSEKIPRDRHRF